MGDIGKASKFKQNTALSIGNAVFEVRIRWQSKAWRGRIGRTQRPKMRPVLSRSFRERQSTAKRPHGQSSAEPAGQSGKSTTNSKGMVPSATHTLDDRLREVFLMKDHREKEYLPKKKSRREEKPISRVYPVIDNDLARDNLENDLPAADLEDL